MAARIRKGDRVAVLTGRDRGKRGEVLRVLPDKERAVVQGVNMVTKHRRGSAQGPGGVEEIEATVHLSNLAHIDSETDKPTRVGFRFLEDGRKVRFARGSGTTIDR